MIEETKVEETKVEETKSEEATPQEETKVEENNSDVNVEKLQEQMKKMEYTIVKLKKEKKADKDEPKEDVQDVDVDVDSVSAIAEKAAEKIINRNKKDSILNSMGDELKDAVEDLLDNNIKDSGNVENDIAIAVSILKAQENSEVLNEIKRFSSNKKTIDSSGDIEDTQDGNVILSGKAKDFADKAKAFREANGIG